MRIQQLTKKFQKNQSGRSMVEMLGVLAIIGVLSVGAISAYQYAMKRHQVNTYLNRFSMIYNAAQFAYHQPNSYMSCCSFDSVGLNGEHFMGCARNGADWRDEQRAEILSYLGEKSFWCPTLSGFNSQYCFLKGTNDSSSNRFGWEVIVKSYSGVPALVLSFYLPRDLDDGVCADVVRAVASSRVYSETMLGFHYLTETGWTHTKPTEENIKTICAAKNGLSFHFRLPSIDQCDP